MNLPSFSVGLVSTKPVWIWPEGCSKRVRMTPAGQLVFAALNSVGFAMQAVVSRFGAARLAVGHAAVAGALLSLVKLPSALANSLVDCSAASAIEMP